MTLGDTPQLHQRGRDPDGVGDALDNGAETDAGWR
jgi:hypothetical protein